MWIWLVLAILSELVATLCLRLSEGMTRLVPAIFVVIGYGSAFFAMSRALVHGMDLSSMYAIWAGAGVALVAIASVILFQESLGPARCIGLALIVCGVILVESGGRFAS